MKNTRIGVIGAGNIARAHLPAIQSGEGIEIAGVCDVVKERAVKISGEYDNARIFDSAKEMCESPDVDGVVLAIPNDQHEGMCLLAAKNGKAILCEKPMTLSVEKAEGMMRACEDAKVPLLMGFCTRFDPSLDVIKRQVDAGNLGNVYFARTDYLRQRGAPDGWFGHRERSGGGPLIDIGVHMIDACWYLMGKPKPVKARAFNFYNKIANRYPHNEGRYSAYDRDEGGTFNVEDSSHGLITFDNGAGLMYQASWSLNWKEGPMGLEVFGEKGGAKYVCEAESTLIREECGGMTETNLKYKWDDCFKLEEEHFGRVIRGEEAPRSPAIDGLTVEKILCALYRSAELGREVDI